MEGNLNPNLRLSVEIYIYIKQTSVIPYKYQYYMYIINTLCRTIQPMVLDQHYISLKNQVIKAERRVLKELGFCVHVKHPHKVC